MCGEDSSKDWLRFFEGEDGAGEEGLEKGAVGVVVVITACVRHCVGVSCSWILEQTMNSRRTRYATRRSRGRAISRDFACRDPFKAQWL